MPTTDALIKSPWHTLKVNGKTVPVYTARCGKGSHSYAWVDLLDNTKDFALETELTLSESAAKCVVLPLNKNVEAKNPAIRIPRLSRHTARTRLRLPNPQTRKPQIRLLRR